MTAGGRGPRLRAGRAAGDILRCSWREANPPPPLDPDQLGPAISVLVATRAAGMAWPSLAVTGGTGSGPGTAALRDAYATNALGLARREAELQAVFEGLGAAGIDAVVIKGWDLARRYPHRGQRSPGDIDLCVAPGDRERTRSLVADLGVRLLDVRHVLMAHMAGHEEGVIDRRDSVRVGSTDVGVPSVEDALRLSCLHVLQHGANWPHSLCDVALLVESQGHGIEWDLVTGEAPLQQTWVLSVLALARDLLGADIATSPAAGRQPWRRRSLESIWRRWGAAGQPGGHDRTTRPLHGLRSGWTDPISSAFRLGRPAEPSLSVGLTLRHYLRQHLAGARARLG